MATALWRGFCALAAWRRASATAADDARREHRAQTRGWLRFTDALRDLHRAGWLRLRR